MQVSIFGILGIVFIVLKLLETITWPWYLVLLPFYGPLVIAAVFFGSYLVLKD